MLFFPVIIKKNPTREKGYTLFELLIIVILIGILSAIGAPSLFSWVTRAKVNDAQTVLKGAFSEAQREAIRKSKKCNVTIPIPVTPATFTVNPTIQSNCFVLGPRTLNGVKIRHNGNTVFKNVTATTSTTKTATLFDFKGRTEENLDDNDVSTTDHLVIVISPSDNDSSQKCLVISDDLGLIRSGNYLDANNTTTTDFTKCNN